MSYREKLAYLAAIIDTSSSFFIQRGKDSPPFGFKFILRIDVSSIKKDVILWIFENFGGRFSEVKCPSKKRIMKEYVWTMSRNSCFNILEELKEFVISKKEHCDIAIKYRKTFLGSGNYISQEVFNIRCELYEQMRNINSKRSKLD